MTEKENSKVHIVDDVDYGNESAANESGNTEKNETSVKGKTAKNKKKAIIREILSYVFYLALAFALAILWKNFVMTKVEVVSGSMEKTLFKDDRLVSSKLPYIFGSPQRGDIVVFHCPDNNEVYIKRLIGLPGETVEMKAGYVYIDGVLLEEDYVVYASESERLNENFGPFVVPQDGYFMLGDNRKHSQDARYWEDKYVVKSQILGKAIFRYKPKLEKIYK